MRVAVALVALLAAGCGKSRCEKYAEMEIRCGGVAKSEEDVVRHLAEGMCETTEAGGEVGTRIKQEADCAAKFFDKDCAAYKQCTAALK